MSARRPQTATVDRRRGVMITAFGVLALSPDSILIRLLGADIPTTLFWRGLAMGLGLSAWLLLRDRGDARAILAQLRQPLGWGLAVLFALTNILFVSAITLANVADTLACLATASLFAALFSALFLGERIHADTWVAALAIACGLFLIAAGGAGSPLGRVLGIATAAVFGGAFVVMRATGDGDTLPGLALGSLLVALVAALPATPGSLAGPGWAALAGLTLILPLAFALIGRGPRYLPAPEVSLLMLLETVFGTLWAWLFLGEIPGRTTVIAIVIILGTLAAFYARQAQRTRRVTAMERS